MEAENIPPDALNTVVDKIAAEVAGRIAPPIPVEIDLWDAAQIGKLLKVCPRQVSERYSMLPDFPQPVMLPSGGAKQNRRWKAKEIIAWIESLQRRKVRRAA